MIEGGEGSGLQAQVQLKKKNTQKKMKEPQIWPLGPDFDNNQSTFFGNPKPEIQCPWNNGQSYV